MRVVRYSNYFLLLFFVGVSCKSPSQPDNNSLIITANLRSADLALGDTLYLNIHASGADLHDGSVDFGDTSIVYFNNLSAVFDTIITHLYSSIGTYRITASFSDGVNSTSEKKSVNIGYPAPRVEIISPKDTSGTSITLRANLNLNHHSIAYHFEYGLDTGYGTTTKQIQVPAETKQAVASVRLKNLTPGTTYHYRIVLIYDSKTNFGGDETFATYYDIFPLEIGKHIVYDYKYDYESDDPFKGSFKSDSGTVEYTILDSTRVNDSTLVWTVDQTKHLLHHYKLYDRTPQVVVTHDTTYWVDNKSEIKLTEYFNGLHVLKVKSLVWSFDCCSPGISYPYPEHNFNRYSATSTRRIYQQIWEYGSNVQFFKESIGMYQRSYITVIIGNTSETTHIYAAIVQ